MTREEILDELWKETEHKVFITKREFIESLKDWVLTTKELEGDIVGATLVHGPEFHFITFGPKKRFTRALMTDCVAPIIKQHGFVRTKTPTDDTRQRRFNLLVGFRVESTDEFFTYYRMDHLNLHGVAQCLS